MIVVVTSLLGLGVACLAFIWLTVPKAAPPRSALDAAKEAYTRDEIDIEELERRIEFALAPPPEPVALSASLPIDPSKNVLDTIELDAKARDRFTPFSRPVLLDDAYQERVLRQRYQRPPPDPGRPIRE